MIFVIFEYIISISEGKRHKKYKKKQPRKTRYEDSSEDSDERSGNIEKNKKSVILVPVMTDTCRICLNLQRDKSSSRTRIEKE